MFLNAIFFAFVVCLATRVWTGFAFHRARGNEVPTLPYWIPGIAHGASLLYGGNEFLAATFKRIGNNTPFYVKAGHFKILILSDPVHIRRILRDAHDLSADKTVFRVYETILGAPKEAVSFYRKDKNLPKKEQTTPFIHKDIFKQQLFGTALIPTSNRFLAIFQRNILVTCIKGTVRVKGWMDVPDLYAFLEELMTYALIETFCGRLMLKDYPGFLKDFWVVLDHFEDFFKGVPWILMPKAYQSRDRLLRHFKQWGRSTKRYCETRNATTMINPDWDLLMGSSLLQDRERAMADMPLDEDARASEMLTMALAACGNVVPSTFWCIFEALLDSNLKEDLSSVIRQHQNPETKCYDISKLSSTPLMQSMHAESTRLRNAVSFSRFVETDSFMLDDRYCVPKDTAILVMAHQLGLHTESWKAARSGTLKKPLDVFWAQRYLVSEEKEGETVEKFTTSRLNTCMLPFGGGSHKCPGRHFAKSIGVAAMAVLLDKYEIVLRDMEGAKKATPAVGDMAFGAIKPTGKIAARIRMRVT